MSVLVTGMGLISSIGSNVSENLSSLLAKRDGISLIEGIRNMRKPFLGGEVKVSNSELKKELGLLPNEKAHRSGLLGLKAAREAWGGRQHASGIRTGIIFGTTVGGVDLSEELFSFPRPGTYPLDFKLTHDSGFGTDLIADKMGIDGYRATISTACSTAANAILVGARMIRAGILDRVLAGGAEALSAYTLNGFDSLMLYDANKCKPFDENRRGLNLGEAGGFLVLENEMAAAHSRAERLAVLSGWANTCDSFHITASSPRGTGAALGIQEALAMASLQTTDIDYVNAHGTGTPNNDISEANAMFDVFGDSMPPFSSTKAFTGHTLAAAGVVEAIYSILAIREQTVFANINHTQQMKDVSIRPETNVVRNQKVRHVVSSSFGFGGNCTELVFSA